MAKYILAYDIREGHDYGPLDKELAAFSATHLQKSVWSFDRINTNAAGLRAHFVKAGGLLPGDSLFVAEFSDFSSRT